LNVIFILHLLFLMAILSIIIFNVYYAIHFTYNENTAWIDKPVTVHLISSLIVILLVLLYFSGKYF
jgi:hypothetical protein